MSATVGGPAQATGHDTDTGTVAEAGTETETGTAAGTDVVPITIVATNDFHGQLYPNAEGYGGAAYLASHLDQQVFAEHPDALFVDAGDMTGASQSASSRFGDEPTVAVMNLLGLDVTAAGNHEFDRGVDELRRQRGGGCWLDSCAYRGGTPWDGADFDTLTANVFDTTTGTTVFARTTTREVDGVQVAFVGVTVTDLIANDDGRLAFASWLKALNATAVDAKAAGADVVVALRHQGWKNDPAGNWGEQYNSCSGISDTHLQQAAWFDDAIDVVVDGHTHSSYICPIEGGPLFTQAYARGVMFTEISLSVDRTTGQVVERQATNHLVPAAAVEPDPEVVALLAQYDAWWDEWMASQPEPEPEPSPTESEPAPEPDGAEPDGTDPDGTSTDDPESLTRVAGGDRIETAALLSRRFEAADTVLLARADHFADALVAGPMAAQHGAPLLLTGRDGLAPAAVAELDRLAPEHVVLVGGSAALGDQVRVDVEALASVPAGGVRRIAGGDRYETAASIADEIVQDDTREAFLTTGTNFPDALAGAALAAHLHAPVLLTDPGTLPTATADVLRASSLDALHVLGGVTAVSAEVEAVAGRVAEAPTTRIAGGDRYETAARVAAQFPSFSTVFVATGQNFPDALAGVAAAAHQGAPVLLVEHDRLPETSALQVRRVAAAGTTSTSIVVVGGEAAISQSVVDELDPS